jgi:hypothetical protein
LAGNPIDAYGVINSALINAFLPGFNAVEVGSSGVFDIVPIGPLGDLAPIFTIPGQMAQNLTNLLPPGSILEQMAQNGTNLVNVFTNFGTTLNLDTGNLVFGVPLQLIFDGIGGPANALSALNSTGVAFAGAVQAGNASAAAAAILDAPAFMANGFLNGSTLISLPPTNVLGVIEATVQIPLGGILTPLSIPPGSASIEGGPPVSLTFGAGSSGIGGLIPGLLSFGPELAAAITPTM